MAKVEMRVIEACILGMCQVCKTEVVDSSPAGHWTLFIVLSSQLPMCLQDMAFADICSYSLTISAYLAELENTEWENFFHLTAASHFLANIRLHLDCIEMIKKLETLMGAVWPIQFIACFVLLLQIAASFQNWLAN